MAITKERIRTGLKTGLIAIAENPETQRGIICFIGREYFYFADGKSSRMTMAAFKKRYAVDDVVDMVFSTLEEFKEPESGFEDEYKYYDAILAANGI